MKIEGVLMTIFATISLIIVVLVFYFGTFELQDRIIIYLLALIVLMLDIYYRDISQTLKEVSKKPEK